MRPKLLFFLLAPLHSSRATCLGRLGALKVADPVAESAQIGIEYVIEGNHPHPPEKEPSGTVYEVLSSDPKFSKLTKALNFVDDVAALLNDSSAQLTFFAPPDNVLRPPKHDDHGYGIDSDIFNYGTGQDPDKMFGLPHLISLSEAVGLLDRFERHGTFEGDDDKRKKILKLILRSILEYHIVPSDTYDTAVLGHNTTYPTNLTFPRVSDGEPLRLRVSQKLLPPVTSINFFTKIVRPNIKATNGIIHVIDHPLLPPPPIFQELYMMPRFFSILTSALQRSELTQSLDLRFVRGKGLEGASLVTVFAPTNRAFERLPKKLQFFLFSPFGARVLKKLLQYHIAPSVAVYSDYVHFKNAATTPEYKQVLQVQNSEPDQSVPWYMRLENHKHDRHRPKGEPISSVNLTLATLFTNHTIQAHMERTNITLPFPGPRKPSKIETKVFVNHQLVAMRDIVGLNGAIHVIDKLLDPRSPKHDHKHDDDDKHHRKKEERYDTSHDESWDDWEEWLLLWAENN